MGILKIIKNDIGLHVFFFSPEFRKICHFFYKF